MSGAKAVAEVGTGVGVSGLWLSAGMREEGVLTTIDVEPEHQRLAKQAFNEAGITRAIAGRAQDVLQRLADESQDLVFIDADPVAHSSWSRASDVACGRGDHRPSRGARRPGGATPRPATPRWTCGACRPPGRSPRTSD